MEEEYSDPNVNTLLDNMEAEGNVYFIKKKQLCLFSEKMLSHLLYFLSHMNDKKTL